MNKTSRVTARHQTISQIVAICRAVTPEGQFALSIPECLLEIEKALQRLEIASAGINWGASA